MLVRSLLKMPGSTPIPALRALTALLGFKWRIWQEKLLLVVAIKKAEGTLAKMVMEEQLLMGWPGLCQEVSRICDTIGLPDVCLEDVDKTEIKEAIFWHHYAVMKEEMEPLKKLQQIVKEDLRKPQDFLSTGNLDQCRMAMRLRTGMLDIPGDMPGRYQGREGCLAPGCHPVTRGEEGPAVRETRDHLESCEGYSHLWGPTQDSMGIVNYFMDVMRTRAEIRK